MVKFNTVADFKNVYFVCCTGLCFCEINNYFLYSAPEVIEAIQWSKKLDPIFNANYRADPSLTWQYFGSAKGFMRTYPGK